MSIGAMGSSVSTTIPLPGRARSKYRRAINAGKGHFSPRRSSVSLSPVLIVSS
jgi:hypothetical protein